MKRLIKDEKFKEVELNEKVKNNENNNMKKTKSKNK